MIDKTRELTLKILYKIDEENAYSNIALDEELTKNKKNLNEKDIGLISEIVYGTTMWRLTIDTIIQKYSKIKMKKMSKWILNILRMGVYQIVFLDKIPKSAAVNESVNLAKRYGHSASSNFVNAILRKVDKKDYQELQGIKEPIERISKTTSMPIWIIEELMKEKSINEVEEICKSCYIKPKISIRVNNLKTNKEELKKRLQEKNIEVENGILEDFLIINKVKNIESLEEFKKGYFTVQDEAAGLAAFVLQPKENEKILDACSSPGGKTTYLAELMQNKGYIEAWDIHPHRTKLVEKTAQRLGINIIETKVNDATKINEKEEKYDKILLDVPCLGIGVIRRKPDIKWQRKQEDIVEITKIQEQILETCSKYLKKGGELVYSTCSILEDENVKMIEKFLEKNVDFKTSKIEINKDNHFYKCMEKDGYIKVYPSCSTDGFFICKLTKI